MTRTHTPHYGIYTALGLRLGLVFLVYTAVRLCFYLYNSDLLAIDTAGQLLRIFAAGLRFDASAIAYTNALVILLHLLPLKARHSRGYQRAIGWVYWSSNIPMLVLNLGDVVYYRFTGRRTTLEVLEEFGNENPLGFAYFVWDYRQITLTGIAIVLLWVWLYRRIAVRPQQSKRGGGWLYYLRHSVALLAGAYLVVATMRGGFTASTRPIAPSNANVYVDKIHQREMVLNTPFVMLRFIDKPALPAWDFMPMAEAQRVFDPIYSAKEHPTAFSGDMHGRNVVLIIWESLAREWVGALNRHIEGYEGFTPFVDSLLPQSYYYTDAYAGGLKSIDALPAILGGLAKPIVPFVLSTYSHNELRSMVHRLGEQGYETAFFHNAANGSMGFDAMAKQLGFGRYYGRSEYNNDKDYDGMWGIWDEPFLRFVGEQCGRLREPFFVTEFTTSSHSPYKIPEQYEDVFAEGQIPIQRSIRYTDHALKQFFDYARTQPWYMNTLFVITGDHAVAGVLEEYTTSRGIFRVPMIFFDPRGELVGRCSDIVSHADIGPTLLDLLGIEAPVVTFGRNMFDTVQRPWAVTNINAGYQLRMGDYLLQYDGANVLGLYNIKSDPLQRQNLRGTGGDQESQMLRFLQAYLQQLSQRMRDNDLVAKD